jgi:hypothetical protein
MKLIKQYGQAYQDVYRWACEAPVARWVMSGLLLPGSRARRTILTVHPSL